MLTKIKKIINKDNIPVLILLLYVIIIHVKMKADFGDDVMLRNTVTNVFEEFVKWYRTWSSPSLMTIIAFTLALLPVVIFKIYNILTMLLLTYSIYKITNEGKSLNTKYLLVFMIILYPFMQMSTAGWMGTSTQYLTPLAFGLYSFVYLKYEIENVNIKKIDYILFWLCLFMGVGSPQFSCVIFVMYLLFCFYFYYKKKNIKFAIIQCITSLIAIIYHLTSPGNMNRDIQEVITWFPNYNMISTVNKIKMGFTSTLGNFISGTNIFFICFSAIIAIAVWYKYKENLYRAISIIPIISTIIFGNFKNIFNAIIPNLIGLFNNGNYDFVQINEYNFENKINYLSVIIGVVILSSILISLYLVFENTMKMILIQLIFLGGFCSRMIMSFSPTIYASGTRTFIFMYFSMIICTIFIFNEISKIMSEEKQKNIIWGIGILVFINFLELLIII